MGCKADLIIKQSRMKGESGRKITKGEMNSQVYNCNEHCRSGKWL